MRLGAYRFRPSLWPSLAVLLLLPLLLALGFWQLDRAAQKRAWLADLVAASQKAAVDLNAAQPSYRELANRKVIVRGHYDPAHQVLLDNQTRDRQAGYLVLTPLRLAGSDVAILVDRGWLAAPPDRRQLPAVAIDGTAAVTARGVADKGPSPGLKLGEAAAESGWPLRLQYLDYEVRQQRLRSQVLPYLVRLDPDQPQGYRRDWQPVTEMGPSTHIGYAVQWFGLALALVVIYLVVNTKRLENTRRD
jgi:surfeit locus 1 family protein